MFIMIKTQFNSRIDLLSHLIEIPTSSDITIYNWPPAPVCIWHSGLNYISPLVHLTSYSKNKGQMNAYILYRTDDGFTERVWFML